MFLLTALSRLPLWWLYRLSDFLFLIAFYVVGYRRKVVRQNLLRCFPQKSPKEIVTIEKAYYRHLADLMVEVVKALTISAEEVKKRVSFKNAELLDGHIAAGQSFFVVTPHYGNWEWMMIASSLKFPIEISAIYKKLSNQLSDEAMQKVRGRFGSPPIEVKAILREIIRRKSIPTIYAMVADQAPPPQETNYFTTFLGQETAFFTGVEKMARLAKMPVLFVANRKLARGRYEVFFEKIATPPYEHLTQDYIVEQYTKKSEALILENPAFWLWSHRRWKHHLPR